MPRTHTHLTWEEQIKRRRETMDRYYGVVISNALYMERKEMKEQKKIQREIRTYPFNFLQYIGIMYRWVAVEYGMRRVDLDFLLYLQPIGFFTTREFYKFEKQYGTVDFKRWDRFKDNGYVVFHSKHDFGKGNAGGRTKVWTISHKYNLLVTKIHKRLLFLEPLPEFPASVKKMQESIKNYDDLLKEFNEKVRKKADEKSA